MDFFAAPAQVCLWPLAPIRGNAAPRSIRSQADIQRPGLWPIATQATDRAGRPIRPRAAVSRPAQRPPEPLPCVFAGGGYLSDSFRSGGRMGGLPGYPCGTPTPLTDAKILRNRLFCWLKLIVDRGSFNRSAHGLRRRRAKPRSARSSPP